MELEGIGYIIDANIENAKGLNIRDIDFTLSFFVYANRRVTL